MPKVKPLPLKPDIETTIDPDVTRLLDAPMRDLVSKVLDIIHREKDKGIPVTSVHLSKFTDPEEENWDEIVFTVSLPCGMDEAMRHWKRLSYAVGALWNEVSPEQRELMAKNMSIDVKWED